MKTERVYYQLNVAGNGETLRACRRLVWTRPNIYIGRVAHDTNLGLIEIKLISPEPGPALTYYGQLKGRLPEVHKPYVERYLSKHGARW